MALTDENINSGWKAIQSAPKTRQMAPLLQKLRTTLRKFPQSSTNYLPFCPEERSLPAIFQQGEYKNTGKRSLPVILTQGDYAHLYEKAQSSHRRHNSP